MKIVLAREHFDLIYGVGYLMQDSISEIADQRKDTNFAIIDAVVKKDNVASLTFKEQEGSFLVGAAAALSSKTGKVGFVGGMESELIKKFEIGFRAGVQLYTRAEADFEFFDQFRLHSAHESDFSRFAR